jgi:hypothetical protein
VTSKAAIVVLGNFALLATLLLGHLTKTMFLGTLRDQEREVMFDKARYAVTETCLALTIFHEELTVKIFTLFTMLLFSKVINLCFVVSCVQHMHTAHPRRYQFSNTLSVNIVGGVSLAVRVPRGAHRAGRRHQHHAASKALWPHGEL